VSGLAGLNLVVRFVVAELGALAALVVWAVDAFDGLAASGHTVLAIAYAAVALASAALVRVWSEP
jgi:hypothetical protein